MDINSQTWSVTDEPFELTRNFRVIDYLGAGAYGVVCAALDTEKDCYVAIKKCKKIFSSRILAKRMLRGCLSLTFSHKLYLAHLSLAHLSLILAIL